MNPCPICLNLATDLAKAYALLQLLWMERNEGQTLEEFFHPKLDHPLLSEEAIQHRMSVYLRLAEERVGQLEAA